MAKLTPFWADNQSINIIHYHLRLY